MDRQPDARQAPQQPYLDENGRNHRRRRGAAALAAAERVRHRDVNSAPCGGYHGGGGIFPPFLFATPCPRPLSGTNLCPENLNLWRGFFLPRTGFRDKDPP